MSRQGRQVRGERENSRSKGQRLDLVRCEEPMARLEYRVLEI